MHTAKWHNPDIQPTSASETRPVRTRWPLPQPAQPDMAALRRQPSGQAISNANRTVETDGPRRGRPDHAGDSRTERSRGRHVHASYGT